VTDIDPFIMGLVQYAGHVTALGTAALAIIVASGSNNVVKGVYALIFGERRVGMVALACSQPSASWGSGCSRFCTAGPERQATVAVGLHACLLQIRLPFRDLHQPMQVPTWQGVVPVCFSFSASTLLRICGA